MKLYLSLTWFLRFVRGVKEERHVCLRDTINRP